MKNILHNIARKLLKLTCPHKNKTVVFEDYPDRCTHYKCEDCNSDVFEGWD